MVTRAQKVTLGLLGVAAGVGGIYALSKAWAKPAPAPTPTAGGTVSIKVEYPRRLRYPALPYDVTITVKGRATAGVPAPDMYLYIDLVGERLTSWFQASSITYSAVALNTDYALVLKLTPTDVKNLGYSDTGYGSFKARGRMTLKNIVGSKDYMTSEAPFALGVPPEGTVTAGVA
jgi:hypothetical protein